jgi:hypothetical protein
VGFLFTTAGLAHIFVANALLLGLFVGVKKTLSITMLSAGAISLYSTARAFKDSPSGEELAGTSALGIAGLVLPDTFLQVVDTYNRCAAAVGLLLTHHSLSIARIRSASPHVRLNNRPLVPACRGRQHACESSLNFAARSPDSAVIQN